MTNNIVSIRFSWIDWMKAIGMYFIVLGHFFTYGYKYIYIFSVPVFFVISGFLCKKEKNFRLFWKKMWYNLIVPMILICFIYFICNSIGLPVCQIVSYYRIKFYFIYSLLGYQSSLGTLWFVYTLAVIKIIYQFSPNKLTIVCVFVISLTGAYLYNNSDFIHNHSIIHKANAITNVLVAFPFFVIGIFLQRYKEFLINYNHLPSQITGTLICIIVIYICGTFNGKVWMFNAEYGNNIILFLLGGLAGSVEIFLISKILSSYSLSSVHLISKGSIIILGFHVYIIWFIRYYITGPSSIDYISALVILLSFVPIISISDKYCPILLGKYRK